jgi:GNAT superfamily N-acetyltransferase
MKMENDMITIENSTLYNMEEIQMLYDHARDYQRQKESVVLGEIDNGLLEKEIMEKRQWKLMIDNEIACVWVITFNDEEIWDNSHDRESIYIHRIATNPIYRGRNLIAHIVEWAKKYAVENQKRFVRLDTVGENKGLIKHYTGCGFTYLGSVKLIDTKGLPSHYQEDVVCLFEYRIAE